MTKGNERAPHHRPAPDVVPFKRQEGIGFIYCLQQDVAPFKIKYGEASGREQLIQRWRSHELHQGERIPMSPHAFLRGTVSNEKYIHREFRNFAINDELLHFKKRGKEEWYKGNAGPLVRYNNWLSSQSDFVTNDIDKVNYLPLVTNAWAWMPVLAWDDYAPRGLISSDDYIDTVPGESIANDDPDHWTPSDLSWIARRYLWPDTEIEEDPCSSFWANKGLNNDGVKAKHFYSFKQNGLNHKWYGRTWINPPTDLSRDFLEKAFFEYDAGRVTEFVMYLSVSLVVCRNYAYRLKDNAAQFIPHQIPADNGALSTREGPRRDPRGLYYIGNNPEHFCECFSRHGNGTAYMPWKHLKSR